MATLSMRGGTAFVIATLALGMWYLPHTVLAQDRGGEDPRKEYARGQYTAFCAKVRRPPAALGAAIERMQADPSTWGPLIVWLANIAEAYRADGCGES